MFFTQRWNAAVPGSAGTVYPKEDYILQHPLSLFAHLCQVCSSISCWHFGQILAFKITMEQCLSLWGESVKGKSKDQTELGVKNIAVSLSWEAPCLFLGIAHCPFSLLYASLISFLNAGNQPHNFLLCAA